MQALADFENSRMKVDDVKETTSDDVVLRVNSDIAFRLDPKGNIVRVIITYDERSDVPSMVAHLEVLTGIAEKAERAILNKTQGSIKPWQPSA